MLRVTKRNLEPGVENYWQALAYCFISSKVPTPLAGIIEHVFSSSFVSVYVFKLHAQIKM